EPPGPEAFQEMQKVISPEDYKKMTSRMFKNFGKLFGGEDNPLSKLFGGEDNPLSKMFGGNGENPFGKMFGEDAPDLGKLFQDMFGGGGKPGEGLDLQKLLDPDGPLGKLFGGKPGEGLDLGKLLDPDGPLGKMFGGGGNGEAPDLQKMFQDMFGGKNPFGEKQPRQAPTQTKRPYLGLRVANTGDVGGLLIEDVQAKGPAEAAGLRKGDLLLAIDGRSVSSMQALQQVMGSVAAGQKIKVKVLRTQLLDSELVERELTFSVTLGSR
ncbi:MAG: S1C family serine protease, partial [Planctomycetota bacterium]